MAFQVKTQGLFCAGHCAVENTGPLWKASRRSAPQRSQAHEGTGVAENHLIQATKEEINRQGQKDL
jgi:hypothetical protein